MDYNTVDTHSQLTQHVIRTKRNIKGWYFYCFSSEPFVVSAVATYIPLLLEKFARLNGVKINNHSIPCIDPHTLYNLSSNDTSKCVVPIFNDRMFIDTSSFPLYVFSISVLFQTVLVITVSGLVDLRDSLKFKKWTLITFGVIGSISTIFISRLNSSQLYTLPTLYILANSCFGVINVVGNSLLPRLIHDSIKFLPHLKKEDTDNQTTMISGRGASLGYSSALVVQIISIFLVKNIRDNNAKLIASANATSTSLSQPIINVDPLKDIQIPVLFVGIWWFFWQLPMIWLLSDLTFLSTSTSSHVNRESSASNLIQSQSQSQSQSPSPSPSRPSPYSTKEEEFSLSYGWLSLWESFKHARLLKDVMIFLLGWFIISDSITTINSTAILFSRTQLDMSTLQLIIVSILTMISAMIGAFMVPQFLSKRFHWSPKKILLFLILWATFIPFYGILGFFFNSIGLKEKFEMFLLAIWYGLSLGGLSAVSRSLFTLIIPKGKESTFFSMFSITDKGSSIVGPFLIGLVTDKTHNIRYSFYLLFTLLILSLPIIKSLNLERGKREAQQLSKFTPHHEHNERVD
ncbi:Atg22p NDAI_0A00350 [Naumovozyma dairenensis CBS 421]|uniref:Autophagy-related protein n=1 Tax=Naumovozyma dairenensis (strain ATCC 10597 / BCRC 20456 / CBS 421 / NBRC 0211 / NRRL Y-12639) TaxID=1071378 RepID=G0W5I1_NAUDC|nr:hypothetical protein NDAI_0A00350 [Naumovozyma dairenensis CBS 421]CCD22195.1 hypothetical protein NDAI_0A00350 [Naumovozyma dairenensis CBS 421]